MSTWYFYSYFRELHVDLLPELAVAIHDMKLEGNVRSSRFVCRSTSIIKRKARQKTWQNQCKIKWLRVRLRDAAKLSSVHWLKCIQRHLAGPLCYKSHLKFLLRWCQPIRLQKSLKSKINLIQIASRPFNPCLQTLEQRWHCGRLSVRKQIVTGLKIAQCRQQDGRDGSNAGNLTSIVLSSNNWHSKGWKMSWGACEKSALNIWPLPCHCLKLSDRMDYSNVMYQVNLD